jgi:hypothetical protein
MVRTGRRVDNGVSHSNRCYSVQARNDDDGGDCNESSINYSKYFIVLFNINNKNIT